MKPAVSVVMPVRNAAATVAAAIASLTAQTLADFELIAVDDGSTDATRAILAACARADARVRVLERPPGGIVAALQAGVTAAQADAIARMDADDLALPRRLELQHAFLSAHPGIGLVGGLVEFGGDPARHAGYAAHVEWLNEVREPAAIALKRFVESPFAHPSVMFRRACVERFGGYREGLFPEDYELWLRWLDAGVEMAKVPEPVLVWNDPPDRLSRTDPRYSVEAFCTCKAEYLARWLARHNPHHPEAIVWGAGRETRRRAERLTAHGVRIVAYGDIDPDKIGQAVGGRPVVGLHGLPPPGEAFVVSFVGSRGAHEVVRKRLAGAGWTEGTNFILAA